MEVNKRLLDRKRILDEEVIQRAKLKDAANE
jgi:hypothetical protein